MVKKGSDDKHSKNYFLSAGLVVFFYNLGFYLIVSMLPIIVREELNLTTFIITFLFSLRYISALIYDGFLSSMIKQITIKTALFLGIIGLGVVFFGFYFWRSFIPYIALFILLGILGSLVELKTMSKAQRDGKKGVSIYYSSMFAGILVAFLMSGFILQYTSLETLVGISLVCFAFPLIIMSFSGKFKKKHSSKSLSSLLIREDFIKEQKKTFEHFYSKTFFVFLTKFILVGFASLRNVYLPLIVVNFFMKTKQDVSLLLAVSFIPSILIPKYLDKILLKLPSFFFVGGHKRKALDFGLFIMALSCFLIPFSKNMIVFSMLIILASIGFSLSTPILDLIIVKYYKGEIEEESGLLHFSAQAGKVIMMFSSGAILAISGSIMNIFFFPAIIFAILFVYLMINAYRAGKIEGIKI